MASPKLPDPFARYRGYSANVLNNGFCLMTQFYLNGIAKRMLTGGAREATPAEQLVQTETARPEA